MHKIKRYIYHTLQFRYRSKVAYVLNGFIILLILLSVPVDVIESVGTNPRWMRAVLHLDLWISLIFLAEYLLRLWTCSEDPRYAHPIKGRLKYMFTPLMLIDFFAISPFFILGAGFLRTLRVFRILMLMRYTNAIQLMNNVITEKKSELMICGAFILMLWVWSSFMIFRVEHAAQPLVFKNITDALWWSVVTFTTIGYGDIYPVTYIGKALAAVTVALGLVLFAITTAVLTAGIVQEMKKYEDQNQTPPEV
ncbi:MAG: ion transporter [Elusimicrobiaceae bacterium]|nr:ion transporter [Elusimicrobiaceae bacterium]